MFFFELENKYKKSEIKTAQIVEQDLKDINKYENIKNGENKEKNYDPPHPKIYFTCYLFNEEIEYNTKKGGKNVTFKLNTQKALVISSFYQFHSSFYSILPAIKKCSNVSKFELEKLIHSLIFDIPSPCPGIYTVEYQNSGYINAEFKLYPINKIPKAISDLKLTIEKLTIRKVLEIVKYVILEVPVIVFGLDKFVLANVVKSLEEFIYPFTYPYSVITILPKVYYKCLEKLGCFIVGINEKYYKKFFENNNINLNDRNYVIVSLSEPEPYFDFIKKLTDKYGIILKDYNKSIKKEEEDKKNIIKDVSFPKHYLMKLMKNLNQIFSDLNKIIKTENDIREQFYYFFISMLQHYKTFLNNNKINLKKIYNKAENNLVELINVNELFKFQDFILKTDDSLDFFNSFMSTRIWKSFIIKNIYPLTVEEKLEVLLFDDNIRRKKNRKMIKQLFKEYTYFLETDIFDYQKKEEIKISDIQGIDQSSIDCDNIEDKPFVLDDEKFDLLFHQNFIKSNKKVKNLYVDFYDKCNMILKDNRFLEKYNNIGYDININEELKSNNENYVQKIWFIIICYIFKHLDKGEKWVIFNELLKEIQSMSNLQHKISIIDPFISNLLFTTFIKYGDKQMCSLLYKELYNLPSVKEDYLIFTQLHKKFVNKKEEFKFSLPKEAILKERNYNLFGLMGNKPLTKILLVTICNQCRIKIDVYNAIMNYSSVYTNRIFTKCSICKQDRVAKFTISVVNSANDTAYVIYSPKFIFHYINNLGDFNNETFYKEHLTIFFNIIILFYIWGYSYDFIFPYKEKKYLGFDTNCLNIEKTGEDKYIQKKQSKNKIKWYENIVPTENKFRLKRFSNFIHSRKASAGTFKSFDGLNTSSFLKSSFKKKKDKTFYTLKYSKTISEC